MIVPSLRSHLDRYEQTGDTYHCGYGQILLLELAVQPVDDGGYAHAAPDGEGIERACIGIIALTGLHRRLVQIDHDGETRHEEKEEDYPELADADGVVDGLVAYLALAGVPSLPEES